MIWIYLLAIVVQSAAIGLLLYWMMLDTKKIRALRAKVQVLEERNLKDVLAKVLRHRQKLEAEEEPTPLKKEAIQ